MGFDLFWRLTKRAPGAMSNMEDCHGGIALIDLVEDQVGITTNGHNADVRPFSHAAHSGKHGQAFDRFLNAANRRTLRPLDCPEQFVRESGQDQSEHALCNE